MLWPSPTQSSRGTGSEGRSRPASQAPAQDQFNHLPNPIGYLLNPIGYLLNPLSYLLNPLGYLPNPLGYLPNPLGHQPNPLGYLPNQFKHLLNPLQPPPAFVVVQLELLPFQLQPLSNQLQQFLRLQIF